LSWSGGKANGAEKIKESERKRCVLGKRERGLLL
jgi:hypothetical protein